MYVLCDVESWSPGRVCQYLYLNMMDPLLYDQFDPDVRTSGILSKSLGGVEQAPFKLRAPSDELQDTLAVGRI